MDHKKAARIFHLQKEYQYTVKAHTTQERIAKLIKLRSCIKEDSENICKAIAKDFGKPKFETALTEVNVVLKEIDYVIDNLGNWVKGVEEVTLLPENQSAKGRIIYEPKGVCLIIAPWNFPFQLQLLPLIAAIAAGNCCILKPSDMSPATSNAIAQIITSAFEEREIAVIQGGISEGAFLLTLPFDHIFYTGSSSVGKIVMEAAAKNLASVTLELGGKSPVIVDQHANIELAALDIAWGKGLNAGQICVAPDYVLVPAQIQEQLLDHLCKAFCTLLYTDNGMLNKNDFARMINRDHFERLKRLFDDAVEKGARVVFGGIFDTDDLTMHPTILTDIPEDALLLQEEIFGPLIPIIPYNTLEGAAQYINSSDKPLALYIYSQEAEAVEYLIRHTTSGGVCVNGIIVHLTDPNLPFGGVNTSGMGSYHGIYGFKTFSHERSVYYQVDGTIVRQFLYPPYAGKEMLIQQLME